MALLLTQDPEDIVFSKNPIEFTFSNSHYKMLLEIYVQDPTSLLIYNLITTLDSLDSDPTFDVWEYIDNELFFEFPPVGNNNIIQSYTQRRKYKLVAKAYDVDGVLQTTLQVDNGGNNYIALKGGFSYEHLNAIGTFKDYVTNNKGFLSWNNTAHIHIDQLFYIPFIRYFSAVTARLWTRVYYTDDTQETYQKNDLFGDQWLMFQIAAGWEALQSYYAIVTARVPYKYEFSIRNAATGDYLSEVFTVHIHTTPYRYSKTFYYYNSFSGLQVLFATGSIEETKNTTTLKGELISDDRYKLRFETYARSKRMLKVASGFVHKEEYEALFDLLHCEDVREVKEVLVKLNIDKRTWKLNQDDYMHNFMFAYMYDYEDRVANPESMRTLSLPAPKLLIDDQNHYLLIDNNHRLNI